MVFEGIKHENDVLMGQFIFFSWFWVSVEMDIKNRPCDCTEQIDNNSYTLIGYFWYKNFQNFAVKQLIWCQAFNEF